MPSSVKALTRRISTLSCLLFAATLLGVPQATSAQEIDLTGEWILTVDSPNGSGTRDVTFVQEGDELTGTIASSRASGDLTGTVEDGVVTFVALVIMDGGGFEIVYTGKFVDGKLSGSVDFGDYGGGTFSGVRKEGHGTVDLSNAIPA